jgi:hypothetical protein
MVSRYDTQTSSRPDTDTTATTAGTSRETSSGVTTGSTSSSQSQRTSSSGVSTTSFDVDTISPAGRQALDRLIGQLQGGGTPEQQKNRQLILGQVQNLESLSRQYSRQNAFADAEGLVSQTLRRAMETALPTILQAQAAAGTSGDALSALLTQDLATRSSESAAAQGLGAATDYGQILAQLQGQKTQAVTSLEDTVTQALLQALQTDVGSQKRGTETTRTKQKGTQQTSGTQQTQQTTQQTTDRASQQQSTERTQSI